MGREGSETLSELVWEERGASRLKFLSQLHIQSTHTHTHTYVYTHTYCPGVSATADWRLTIHRKVNKLLSVLCRGLHCPLASNPCILHITHARRPTRFLTISPPSPYSWNSTENEVRLDLSVFTASGSVCLCRASNVLLAVNAGYDTGSGDSLSSHWLCLHLWEPFSHQLWASAKTPVQRSHTQ